MRGRTLNEAFIILDEAQNTTPEQMKMFLTRIGFGSKVVVTGDASQTDLAEQLGDEFATALARLPVGTWTGPVVSGFGLHLVRIDRRVQPPPPRLADVRQRLENDWRSSAIRKAQDAHLQQLMDSYSVEIKRPS
jgi:hypothetical protein